MIPDQLLADWFTKSLLPQTARYIAMGGFVTEEHAITRAQYMNLVDLQSGMLYDIIPHASWTMNDPTTITSLVKAGLVDGVIGTISKQNPGKESNMTKSVSTLAIQNSNSP